MSTYAILEISGKQYKVGVGSELVVDRLPQTNGKVVFDKVLLLDEDGKMRIGTPTVPGVQVAAEVLREEKGEKVTIQKFKAKSRYRKKMGFRAKLTRIKIESIESAPKKTSKQTQKK